MSENEDGYLIPSDDDDLWKAIHSAMEWSKHSGIASDKEGELFGYPIEVVDSIPLSDIEKFIVARDKFIDALHTTHLFRFCYWLVDKIANILNSKEAT